MAGIDTGWIADEVLLRINGEDVLRKCVEYSVNISVFRQPATFTAKLGITDLTEFDGIIHDTEMEFELRLRHRPFPGAEPELDVPLQTGRIDKVQISDTPGTTITYTGRDNMRALFKSFFHADTSYSEKSYFDLVVAQLKAVGIDTDVDLLAGEEARVRMAVTGTQTRAPRAQTTPPDGKTEQIQEQTEAGTANIVYNTITGNAGEQRFAWTKAQLQRAGLFLWCMSDGKFCLGAPTGDQEPALEIYRRKDGSHNARLLSYTNDSTNLHHIVRVHGRAGGGKDGQRQIIGEYANPSMQGRTARYDTPETVRLDIDNQIRTQREAEYKARRLAAEERREAFNLEYEMSGHTTPCIIQPGLRTVALPNFCCKLCDEWMGFDFPMYIGDTTFSRSGSGTSTRVKIYRPDDLVFAIEER